MPIALSILFVLLLGCCVGSFLNVVIWRLPRVEYHENDGLFRGFLRSAQALSWPPSHCPRCGSTLKWYDNLPVIGWLKLAGRCRSCREPISIRYPLIEALTGLLFVFYFVMFFVVGFGPGLPWTLPGDILQYRSGDLTIAHDWPVYLIDMVLLAALLAASAIDANLFIIPLEIPWSVIPFALLEHALRDRPGEAGALLLSAPAAALAAGAGIGLIASFLLWWLGFFPASFADGGPLMEIERADQPEDAPPEREYTRADIRREMGKEMLFLLPPLCLGFLWLALTLNVPSLHRFWERVAAIGWAAALLGSVMGLLVGGFVVWLVRILGSLGFGREAVGMGDVHLMAAVGAVLGPGAATIAFFIAPVFGLARAIGQWISRKGRELPLGPYLSLGAATTMLFYNQIANYLLPGLTVLLRLVSQTLQSVF